MEKEIETKIPEIKLIFAKYGAKSAYLFGSYAANKVRNDSDVDFLFSFQEGINYEVYGDNYFSLLNELQTLLNKSVDLISEKTLKNPYLIQSINENRIKLI